MRHFQNDPWIEISLLLSNNPNAYALDRARRLNVPTRVFSKAQLLNDLDVKKWLVEANVTHVILAGFLWLIPQNLLLQYPGKIINIHPALLPKFGGKGMYGSKVHEAVKASGDTLTGITIHVVNENFDEGKILFQAACVVHPSDTVDTIASKVHMLEHAHYPIVIEDYLLLTA